MFSSKLNHYLPNVIVTVILTFVIIAAVIVNFVVSLVLDKTTYVDAMYKNNVDKIVYDDIMDYFDKQYAYTGIEADVFKKVVSQDDISAAIYSYIDANFEYMTGANDKKPEFVYDFDPIEKALNEDYERWAGENKAAANDDNAKKNIEFTLKGIRTTFESKIDVMMLSELNKIKFTGFVHNHYGQLKTIRIISIAACVVLIILLVLLNLKSWNNVFYWLGCSALSSGVIIALPMIYLSKSKFFDKLILTGDAIYKSLTTALYSITDQTVICALIIAACSVIFFILNMAMYKGWFIFSYTDK